MRLRFLLLALAVAAIPLLAHANPRYAFGADYTIGNGGHVADFDLGIRSELGVFFRKANWQATLSIVGNPRIATKHPERDTEEMHGIGFGGRVMYRMPLGGGVLAIGGGLTRRWVFGKDIVTRQCMQTGTCVAGTYMEQPTYHAWAPQLRISVGPEKLYPRLVMAASFDIIVEAIGFNDVPPDGIREIAVTAGATFTIGGGPRRR